MFRIQEHHQEAFQQNAVSEFIAKTVIFLRENQPDWCETKTEQEIQEYVESIIAFAGTCSIDEALAIQKLVFYKIELGFSAGITLPPRKTPTSGIRRFLPSGSIHQRIRTRHRISFDGVPSNGQNEAQGG